MDKRIRVCIVGADGFIGRNLTAYLSQMNCVVWANVLGKNVVSDSLEEMSGVSVIAAPINELARQIDTKLDVVVYLAWDGVKPEQRDFFDIQYKNVAMAISCAEQAVKLGAKKFITPGSTNEYLYGNALITDTPVPSPRDAYGSVKVAVRYLLEQFLREQQVQFIYPIITGIYSEDRRDSNVIYYTIEALLKKQKPRLTSLGQMWDYVHLNDVMEALYLLITRNVSGKVYPIGHGDNWPLKNYIYIIRDLIDENALLGIGEIPYQSDELPSSCMDLSAISRDVGFIPKITFKEGASRMIERMRKEITP